MHMPRHSGLQYIIQACCSLTSYAEFKMLMQENGQAIRKFIFQEILCCWGAITEIIMDNGTPIIAALDWLAKKYHINHIRISAYKKQANGLVECSHHSIRESIVKGRDGDISRWPEVTPYVFWADRVTVGRDLGFSPFYMAHRVHPIPPFDVTEATFLIPKLDSPLSTQELIAIRACQLQKCPEALAAIKECVLKSCYTSIGQFEKDHVNLIVDYDFKQGALVLVRNSSINTDLSRKTKPRYLGPLIVIRCTRNKAYILSELDGAIHKNPYMAFHLIPYSLCSRTLIPITSLVTPAELATLDVSLSKEQVD